MGYWLLLGLIMVAGLIAQAAVKSTYRKWAQVPISSGLTGSQTARNMLDASGLASVGISQVKGTLTDNYSPTENVLHLSQDVMNGRSVAATAVACHESGHAVQHAKGYSPAKFRLALFPLANISSQIWFVLMFIGFMLNFVGLVYAAIALFAFAVLFQVVTLPVEFDASRRAMETISQYNLPAEEIAGARKVLTAAAMTYVVAALASLAQLLYYLSRARR